MVDARPYDRTALTDLFVELSDRRPLAGGGETTSDNRFVREKTHIAYLDGYLVELGCKTIVVERDYIDRGYLEDFAAYHVRSFHRYESHCARLHFFARAFTGTELAEAITAGGGEAGDRAWQERYLGFVVVKPLPKTVIGRTCLKVYPPKRGVTRHYPANYRQPVNLYGLDLYVDTVPFQEQDRDVAACATSALWSVLQCTGRRFQHAIPSPIEITEAATAVAGSDERVLPNVMGLTARQIADAIRSVKLEPYLFELDPARGLAGSERAEDESEPQEELEKLGRWKRIELKIAASAYLRAGIPCLLLMRMVEEGNGKVRSKAKHAVALTGYRTGRGNLVAYGETDTLFAASRVDKLFVHDDQVGPFARMAFDDSGWLTTSWPRGVDGELRAQPATLIVPLYHKVRIPLGSVLQVAQWLDKHIEVIRSATATRPARLKSRLVWDVALSTIDAFRKDVRESTLADEEKVRLLTAALPRFVWRLMAHGDKGRLFEILLDPTDLLQGRQFLTVIGYDAQALEFAALALKLVPETSVDSLPAESVRQAMVSIAARVVE